MGLVTSDDDQGIQFVSDIRGEMKRNGVCLAFVHLIPENMKLYMTRAEIYYKQILTSSAKVVIIYGEVNTTLEMNIRSWEYLDIWKIWVTTSQWDIISRTKDFPSDSFHGTLTFSHKHGVISKFRNYIQTLNFSKYSEDNVVLKLGWMYLNCSVFRFNCKILNNCSSNTLLEWLPWHSFDMTMNDERYYIYNSVYAVAHAIHEMNLERGFQAIKNPKESMALCWQVSAFHCGLSVISEPSINEAQNAQIHIWEKFSPN